MSKEFFILLKAMIAVKVGVEKQQLVDHCANCSPNEEGCYGGLNCVITGVVTVLATAYAIGTYVQFATMFMKRDKDLSALPPFQYFDGSLELIFDEDDKLSKRDAGGFKYNYCFLHPEHHLTIQYDWNDILGAVDSHIGDMVAHYDINFGDVDMNDTVEEGWKVLMGTGKLVVESSTSFGSNFETCDRDTFDGLAR
ncbi:hypothetical protein RI543_001317 [Arxiozyma heterogenica]|uniref:Uncharacterized protein n=1 Tax=Arxiozyma heterogenica TaxID=278026 RepID=A0AAN8A9B0_9SACH|nr:hypothetical protein RI543_001317 [Kazachstania heterogenica]